MQKAPGGSEPRRAAGRWLRIAVPPISIGISLWLLVGCLYIPTGDNLHLSGTMRDFRPLVGEPGSKQPIAAGAIERGQVERLLGRPPFESEDHSRCMYVLHVKKGVIIFPACFTAADDSDTGIGLVLEYGPDGHLTHWNRKEVTDYFALFGPYGFNASKAVQDRVDYELLSQANASPTTKFTDITPQISRWRIKPTQR
jgi:hypothetical protein